MTLADNDRDESRSAMLAADRDNDPHPEPCRCWPCIQDRADVGDDGYGTTAVFLTAVLVGALLALGLLGAEAAMCNAQPDVERSYCEAGR